MMQKYDMNFKKRKADICLVYKNVDGLDLPMHIYFPNGDIHKAQSVLFIHGGGWNDAIRNKTEWTGGWMANNARCFAEQGFVSIAISYRSLLVSPAMNVLDILKDCTDAIEFLKTHFKFINFGNIAYVGESAGGYITAMLGLSQNDELRPKYAICLNPVLDSLDGKWSYGFKNCNDINKLTPKNVIGDKCAKFLFVHGVKDTTVEIEQTRILHNMLLESNYTSEMIELPDAQHAFGLYDFIATDEEVTKIMEDIVHFLNQN